MFGLCLRADGSSFEIGIRPGGDAHTGAAAWFDEVILDSFHQVGDQGLQDGLERAR